MFRAHTILCPIDFSPSSDHAFELACSLAGDYATRVVVLHVVRPPPPGRVLAELDRYEEAWQALCRVHAPAPDIRVERRYKHGDPAARILEIAREVNADLIVMGADGRGGARHTAPGTVAEQVSREAPCPVLTVLGPEPDVPVLAGRRMQAVGAP